ncbi:cation:proton antiporter [Alishewanella sp. 16-MA]|uniref:Cation:proton antiporter n=1 Tax=Alishewanella maricola TaxID=2795740 RepID=A0ABS8C7F1_9ALTE|nr:cation:proton antiporter [Alishewanella maricola]MCB5228058.1 cation:proton antiporter [Alishewanella maricola]
MEQQHTFYAIFVLGVIFLAILLVRLFVNRRWCPPMLMFMLIGIVVGQVVNGNMATSHLSMRAILSVLGEAGLIMLLFKVGINADLKGLRTQLPNASWIWLWNVVVSGALGFLAAYWILSLDVVTSLFIAIAFTATSVGVTVSLWSDAGKLSTPQGTLLLDVAELDDLSTICLVAMLVALLPLYYSGTAIQPLDVVLNLGYIVLLLTAFAVVAWFFSLHIEPRLTRVIVRNAVSHELVVFMVAVGFIVAALAEVSGLSLAVGAFIAGLAFSRDPSAMHEQPVLNGLYDFLTPFFFISLGMLFEISSLDGLIWPAAVLVLFAILGKILGVMLPAWPRLGFGAALLLGVSMVPRMEIAMVVMQKGLEAGVSQSVFSAMILACFMTVLFTMLGLPVLLRRIPLAK